MAKLTSGHRRAIATWASVATIFMAVFAGVALFKSNQVQSVTNIYNAASSDLKRVTEERDKLRTDNAQLNLEIAKLQTPTSSQSTPTANAQSFEDLNLTAAVRTEDCAWPGNTGYPWKDSSPQLGDVPYAFGFQCAIYNTTVHGFIDFLVPIGSHSFVTQAGIDSKSQNNSLTLRMSLINAVSGKVLAQADTTSGSPAHLTATTTGITKIRLDTRLLRYGESPRDVSGLASWAQPHFE